MKYKRIFLIVIDSVGIGALPDAEIYGDKGANTLKHIADQFKNGIYLPNMGALGLGNIDTIKGVDTIDNPIGSFGKMKEVSVGKDTMTGHWELMGLNIKESFNTFTDKGFPEELIQELETRTNHKFIGNISASGTEIIQKYGQHHMNTKDLILYTSADSVMQIAAHEKIIPIEELYKVCKIARDITMQDTWKLGRIIARPFIGDPMNGFTRTHRRHDYALKPFGITTLDVLKKEGYDVIAVGKINDIFASQGTTESIKTVSNEDGMNKTIELASKEFIGLAFINLVDFDAKFGHRRDPIGYGKELESFDKQLGMLIEKLEDNDLLIITADHGNDPTYSGTDHTREYVPLLVYENKNIGKDLGIRDSFADVGASISNNFNTKIIGNGESFI